MKQIFKLNARVGFYVTVLDNDRTLQGKAPPTAQDAEVSSNKFSFLW